MHNKKTGIHIYIYTVKNKIFNLKTYSELTDMQKC